MNTDLAILNASVMSMTSLEISELVGSRHDSVKRTIERLAEQGVIAVPPTVETPPATGGRPLVEYIFSGPDGKRDSIVVVAQLSPEFTGRLVDRWQELEARTVTPPPPTLPSTVARLLIEDMLSVAAALGVPKSYAVQVAATTATAETGQPWDRLLTQAACMTGVPAEDVLLEPTELGALFDLSAADMNQRLASMGLQTRVAGHWVPTLTGVPLCERHAWARGGKSGYNLKWRAARIEELIQP